MKQSHNHPVLGPIEIERVARARNIRISVRKGRVRVAYPWFSSRERALQFLDTKLDWERIYLYGDIFKSILGTVSSDTQGIPEELANIYLDYILYLDKY